MTVEISNCFQTVQACRLLHFEREQVPVERRHEQSRKFPRQWLGVPGPRIYVDNVKFGA